MRRRLRVEAGRLQREIVSIDGGALRHLHVLRLRAGDHVYLFDGEGSEVEAELLEVGRDHASARPLHAVEAVVEPRLVCWLVQAVPVRYRRMDLVVRQCTEIGVSRVLPVLSDRGRSSGGAARWKSRAERWRRIAAAAAEQSHRRRVPEVDEPVPLAALDWEAMPRPVLVLDPGAEAKRLGDVLGGDATDGVTLVVGPEGGWSEAELRVAAQRGARRVSLGPRVLRADTAGVTALAAVLFAWGDLG